MATDIKEMKKNMIALRKCIEDFLDNMNIDEADKAKEGGDKEAPAKEKK